MILFMCNKFLLFPENTQDSTEKSTIPERKSALYMYPVFGDMESVQLPPGYSTSTSTTTTRTTTTETTTTAVTTASTTTPKAWNVSKEICQEKYFFSVNKKAYK